MSARLNVNIDHIATVRQARRAPEPSVVAAAMMCEQAGADGITVHLRGDRRHIQDTDLHVFRQAVTLVAENPNEVTTEGGLNVRDNISIIRAAVSRLREAGIISSLFIDPDPQQIEAAHEVGAQQIELCTAQYADATLGARISHTESAMRAAQELRRLREAATLAMQYGIRVAAGHGLTYRNVGAVAAIEEITEFNIGHNIIARAVFTGLENAVREMRKAIKRKG